MTQIVAADLFCGAGGTSTGLLLAAEELGEQVQLLAINHWKIAISTHTANHPGVTHYNSDLADVDPNELVPDGKLRLLVASPECTHFSKARGGKPKSKQSRASIKYVLRWIGALDVENLLVENVPEFVDWGPLHRSGPRENKPIKARRGEFFKRFLAKLRSAGYTVEWRIINAADYGDATTRKRLFIMARKGNPITWPVASHSRHSHDLAGDHLSWRPAREVIDWSVKGKSIFNRRKPLATNTLKRIEAGLRKYSGLPFTITTNWRETNRSQPRSLDEPLPTVTSSGAGYLVQPFIMNIDHGHATGGMSCPVSSPMQTILGEESLALVEPFIVPVNHGAEARVNSVDAPMPTITGFDALALAQPFLVMLNGTRPSNLENSARSVDDPVPTLVGSSHVGIASPYLVQYNGSSDVVSVENPLPTQTGTDRFGLVEPLVFQGLDGNVYMLDILFRMLQPRELARAMSFPEDYQFQGTREEVVKQIGNAVPVHTAQALCKALLG